MKLLMSGLLALTWLVSCVSLPAEAGPGYVTYSPGALEAAIGRGETVLVDYKAQW